jgi:hypothetical protein
MNHDDTMTVLAAIALAAGRDVDQDQRADSALSLLINEGIISADCHVLSDEFAAAREAGR